MPHFLRNLDPRRRLATAVGWLVVALSLSFAIIAALWIGDMARASLLQQHGQQRTLNTERLATEFNQALAQRLRSLLAAATLLGTDTGFETPLGLRVVLDELESAYPEFVWIGLANEKGTIVTATGGLLEGRDVTDRTWFTQGLKGPWVGDVYDAMALDPTLPPLPNNKLPRSVGLATPVRDLQQHVVGVVATYLDWRWVQDYIQSQVEALQLHDAIQALVLDRDGTILFGPEALQGKRWRSVSVNDTAFVNTTQTTSNGTTPTSMPRFERLDDGQIVLVTRAEPWTGSALHSLGWHVQLIEPAARVHQYPDTLWIQILWVSLGLGSITALLGLQITRHLTRRLTALTQSVQDVGTGKALRIEIPPGIDEVARVGTAFAELLDALQHERTELRILSSELELRIVARTREIERLAAETRYAVVVRERLKIARDLHDTLAHSMMAMLTEIRLLKKLHIHDPAAVYEELIHAEQVAHQGLKEARSAITQLRFNAVRDVGLGTALADALKLFSERTSLAFEYSSDPHAASIADERAETLFRIAEEALRNVENHAKASVVRVSLRDLADGYLELSIEDDGVGFDPNALYPGHYGLVGLREQAQLIGADLNIQSAPHSGTTLRVVLRIFPDSHE